MLSHTEIAELVVNIFLGILIILLYGGMFYFFHHMSDDAATKPSRKLEKYRRKLHP
jgi:hypothetical protein